MVKTTDPKRKRVGKEEEVEEALKRWVFLGSLALSIHSVDSRIVWSQSESNKCGDHCTIIIKMFKTHNRYSIRVKYSVFSSSANWEFFFFKWFEPVFLSSNWESADWESVNWERTDHSDIYKTLRPLYNRYPIPHSSHTYARTQTKTFIL